MGPPHDPLHCLALYWHGGIDGLDVLHVSTRQVSHSEDNNWTQLPQSELVSLNDWRMLAQLKLFMALQKHSKKIFFRGIQFKDLKHLIDTYDKVKEGETSQSSVVNNASLNELHNDCLGIQSTEIKCNEIKWCITVFIVSPYACLQHERFYFWTVFCLSTSKILCKHIRSSCGRLWQMTCWQNGM